MSDILQIYNSVTRRYKDMGDGSYAEVVHVTGGDTAGTNTERELVVSTYLCKTAFPGASSGDTITATQVIDVSGTTPTTVSTIWRNQSTATDLVSVPVAANLELVGSQALTSAQLAAAGLATNAVAQTIRDRLPANFLTPGLLPVDTLGTPGVPRVQATAGIAATVTLTTTCRRVSMFATQGTWYSISGTATATSHYIASGERLDFDVPASTAISVLRETTDGSIRITELV
jgi:hypothetical protein